MGTFSYRLSFLMLLAALSFSELLTAQSTDVLQFTRYGGRIACWHNKIGIVSILSDDFARG